MGERERGARGERGFTLIELLIVIVILGVLAAIVVFAVGGIGARATTNACKADYKTILGAVEAYKADHGTYAGSMQELASPSEAPTPPYIKTIPSQLTYKIGTDDTGTVTVYVPGPTPTRSGTTPSDCP